MISEAISSRMKVELSSMSTARATAYQQALAQESSYGHDYKSLLPFLRAERFDAVRAASRLARFYSVKLEGFGVDKVTNEICQGDLTQQERDGLCDTRNLQLPFHDREGRSILVKVTSLPLPSPPERELIRSGFMLAYPTADEVPVPKAGVQIFLLFVCQ